MKATNGFMARWITVLLVAGAVVSLAVVQSSRAEEEEEERWRHAEDGPGLRVTDAQHRFLREHFPFVIERFQHLREAGQEEAEDELREHLEELREFISEMMELRRWDPEAFELQKRIMGIDFESEHLGERIRHTESDHEREQMVERLTDILTEAFDLKQRQRRLEAERIERELREIRMLIERRDEHKRVIISRRVQDLTGQTDVLEW